MITAALQEVGPARSIVIDEGGVILAGNATVEAATGAGIRKLQVIEADGETLIAVRRRGLSEAQKARLALLDNRTAELAEGWDVEVLRELQADGVSLDGLWSTDELVDLFGGPADGTPGRVDPDAIPDTRETSIQVGDIFVLGPHRLACGDATDAATVAALMDGQAIDCVITSPPYNVDIKYRSHKDKADRETYLAFITATARAFVPHLAKGRFVAWNIGVSPQTYPHRQVVALEDCGLAFYRELVWRKAGVAYPIFPSTLRSKRVRHYKPNYVHEVIEIFESADEPRVPMVACALCDGSGSMAIREIPSAEGHEVVQLLTNSDRPELGGEARPDARYANDVWQISQSQATVGLKTVGRKSSGLEKGGKSSHMVKEHPAAFPVEVPRALMSFLTGPGERVYDPFGGSGSTLIACEQLGRAARLMELDPVYCQLQIDRWQTFTGQRAVKVGGRG